ncbi:MAG: glycerate kinase [Bacteroidales bacterium]|jgi:glycerate-2-kinase|nr:glycerate kinase [Bacteroidales bacterium]
MNQRQKAIEIFLAGVESVKPDNLIKRYVSIYQDTLQIDEIRLGLSTIKNIYVVGAGKASALMAQTVESILGNRITEGHIITKYGHSVPLKFIGITEAGHPVPDENGIRGTEQILSIVNKAGKEDLVICLISGGGSALLADVPEGCTLEDLKIVSSVLLKVGANITEMNCIRKHLSKVKGGQLARAAFPARVISLILSDVIGDPPDVIASGPTAADPTTFADAIAIMRNYKIENQIPKQIYGVLQDGSEKKRQETLKESDEALLLTDNLIIGTNNLALKRAKEKAESLGYETQIITNKLEGDVVDITSYIVNTTIEVIKDNRAGISICLLFAGEPAVRVNGTGLGGRNQHLAIIAARLIKDLPGITILSAGTDGTDGPTNAAGAVVDTFTYKNSSNLQLDIDQYINNFNSYHFFKQEGGLIITGPTQTNVMDLMVVLID